MTERQLKEEALNNAELMSEEEERSIPTTEEICEAAIAELNRLMDEVDKELEDDGYYSLEIETCPVHVRKKL